MVSSRACASALFCALALAGGSSARAAVYRCLSSDCAIRTQVRPNTFRDRSWTLIVRLYPSLAQASSAEVAGVFTLPGVVRLGASGSRLAATIFREREEATLTAPLDIGAGEPVLIALAWDREQGELRLFARAADRPATMQVESRPDWAQSDLGASTCPEDIDGDGKVGPSDQLALLAAWGPCPETGPCPADINGDGSVGPGDQLALLAALGPCPGSPALSGATLGAAVEIFDAAFMGDVGPFILRAGAIADADFDAIAASDELLAPIFLDTTDAGGALTGVGGVLFSMAHGAPHRIGQPISDVSVLLFDRSAGGRFMDRAQGVQIQGDWLHISPYDEHGYARSPLSVDLADPPYVARPSPLVRQIATGAFTQQIRALVHGNSRVARVSSDNGVTQSYSHGWVSNRPADVVGWLLRPPRAPVGGGAWWGFDHEPAPPVQQGTLNLSTTDFSRFGQNKVTSRDRGPGTVAGVSLGGFYRALAHPEAGMPAAEPVRAGAILLQYPGSGNAIVSPVRTDAIDASTGVIGAFTPVWLDTQRFAYTFTDADEQLTRQSPHYLTGNDIPKTVLRISASAAANAQVGDAVYGMLDGRRSVSIVESIADLGDGTAELLLATELAGQPSPGETLFFGPWAFTWIEVDHPPDADHPWRGVQVVSAGGGGPGPVVILGFSAYVPDKPGMVLATFGAGGDGYRDHLEDEIPGAARRMAKALGVRVALMTPAQQNSTLDDMERYVAQLRLGRPEIEVALLGDGAFNPGITPGVEANNFFTFWNAGFLERAPALNAVAVDGARGQRLGRFLDRVADGQMSDPAHQSSRGAARQAEEWDRLLAIAALPRAGDVDGDDAVGPDDLLAVLAAWGSCAGRENELCPADFDRDGVVGPSDLLALLSAWGR